MKGWYVIMLTTYTYTLTHTYECPLVCQLNMTSANCIIYLLFSRPLLTFFFILFSPFYTPLLIIFTPLFTFPPFPFNLMHTPVYFSPPVNLFSFHTVQSTHFSKFPLEHITVHLCSHPLFTFFTPLLTFFSRPCWPFFAPLLTFFFLAPVGLFFAPLFTFFSRPCHFSRPCWPLCLHVQQSIQWEWPRTKFAECVWGIQSYNIRVFLSLPPWLLSRREFYNSRPLFVPTSCAGILKQSMGARNRVGRGLSYRPASAGILLF